MSYFLDDYMFKLWTEKWFSFIQSNFYYVREPEPDFNFDTDSITPWSDHNLTQSDSSYDEYDYSGIPSGMIPVYSNFCSRLHENPNVTFDIIKNNPILASSMHWEHLVNNMDEDRFWEMLRTDITLTRKFVEKNLTHPNMIILSDHPIITWDLVQKRIDLLFKNTESYYRDTISWLTKEEELFGDIWCWSRLSRNPNITWDIVQNNQDKPWDATELSRNPNITWEIVKNNPDCINFRYLGEYPFEEWEFDNRSWNWVELSRNPNITWDNVKNNLDMPWDWGELSFNQSITWDIVINNPDMPWSCEMLSLNSNITWNIVENNPDGLRFILTDHAHDLLKSMYQTNDITSELLWNWNYLSANPNITWDIVKNNLDKPWNWKELSSNPNITWDIVINNLDCINSVSENAESSIVGRESETLPTPSWNWRMLSINPMTKAKQDYINKRLSILYDKILSNLDLNSDIQIEIKQMLV